MDDGVDPLDAFMATLAIPETASAAASANGVWAQRRPACAADVQASEQQQEIRLIKNRRYRRLQQLLLLGGDAIGSYNASSDRYFSDAMMQQRSPALFHFHLGQYLPTVSASGSSDADPRLSEFLLGTWERSEMESRRVNEQRAWNGFQGVDDAAASRRKRALWRQDGNQDTDDEEEEEEEEDEEGETKEEDNVHADAVDAMTIEDRRQQLIDIMARRFLDGCDHEYVQYDEIDTNEALDDWAQLEQDAEDAYFG